MLAGCAYQMNKQLKADPLLSSSTDCRNLTIYGLPSVAAALFSIHRPLLLLKAACRAWSDTRACSLACLNFTGWQCR